MRARRIAAGEHLGVTVALTIGWVLFWGDLSVANVVSGLVVSSVLLVVFPLRRDVEHVRHHLRPLAVGRLAFAVVADLVASSIVMVRDIVGGAARERPGVVACPLRVNAPGLVTFLTNLLSLTPGTTPIDVTHEPPVIYLHVLRLDDPEIIRAYVSRFERLAVAALGDDLAVAAVSQPPPPPPHLADREAS